MDRDGKEMSEENLSAVTSDKESREDKETLRPRWAWVEHRIRTDSMLRSLERGIKEEKGKDHQRWRIRFFDEAGLFNLTAARQEGR